MILGLVLACAHPVVVAEPVVQPIEPEPVEAMAIDPGHVPTTLPDLELVSLSGEPIVLPSGGVVLSLWASWCPPCRKELPHLQALYEDGAPIVTVSVDMPDKRAQVDAMVAHVGLTAPVAHDIRVAKTFGTVAIPGIYVYSAEGELLFWQEDAFDPEAPAFLAALDAVMPPTITP